MPESLPVSRCQARWAALARGRRRRPAEWLAERCVQVLSFTAIAVILLIFLFVGREAWPIFAGRVDSSLARELQDVIPVEDFDKTPPERLRQYLGLTREQFSAMDRETLIELLKVRIEARAQVPEDKDALINTVRWRYLLGPHQWTGYDRPVYIWQPVSAIHKYNLVPLVVGSLKATLVALAFAVPLALGAAIYVSQLAGPRAREWLKPGIELLAGIPSVVLGFFALIVLASFLQRLFGYPSRLNALVAGIALGLAVIPVVFSIAEDALTSVPRSYTEAALALGSTRWQAAWQIVLPAALPGVFAAVVLGFGRAIGETMIVLMASGNASILSWNPLDSVRTLTATIAAELAETVVGGHHYRMLFVIGVLLFAVTFLSNLAGEWFIHRLKARLEGRR
jgi:phosphate transport system permease protein